MSYDKLKPEPFGRMLILTGDLDPVYVAFLSAGMQRDQARRWLLAYWCFYHAGVAGFMADLHTNDFWPTMRIAAANELPSPLGGRWPRSPERRHFRGAQAVRAVKELSERYPRAEGMVLRLEEIALSARGAFKPVFDYVQSHRGFGPWIGFKAVDMLERCLGVRIIFDAAHVFMFKDPMEGARMVWEEAWGNQPGARTPVATVAKVLEAAFRDLKAPPARDRPPNIQEVETVLCKWKSHMRGHYAIGKDTHEVRAGLLEWARVSATALLMTRGLS